MNKKTIITALLALVAMAGQGQTIKADYEDILDSLPTAMQQYMTMQGVQHFRVTLSSDSLFLRHTYQWWHMVLRFA